MSLFGKPKFWARYSIGVLILVVLLGVSLQSSDPAYDGLEDFIESSSHIKARAGALVRYQVLRARYVSQDVDTDRYNEYQLRIVGAVSTVDVDVRAVYLQQEKEWGYFIVRFYEN